MNKKNNILNILLLTLTLISLLSGCGGSDSKTAVTDNVATIAVTGIKITPTTTILDIGSTEQIVATLTPANASNQTVTWVSSNIAIATVNNSGLITAVATGTATVTATTQDGSFIMAAVVIVNATTIAVTGIKITPTTTILDIGSTEQIVATLTPANASNQTVTWVSSNIAIATVNNSGLITAVATGSATVTATTQDGSYIGMTEVTINLVVVTGILNDTGISVGGNYPGGNNATCIGETIEQQDCKHGRDAQAILGTLTKVGSGYAGFDFTKLDANGNPLVNQTQDYATTPWVCIKDNYTGLIWEVKTNASTGDIHGKDNVYRWGGKTALLTGTYNDWDTLVDGSNNEMLCGFNGWRVPLRNELLSIVNYNQFSPSIDTSMFPNTASTIYWTASPLASFSAYAWGVLFTSGGGFVDFKIDSNSVRLVRSEP